MYKNVENCTQNITLGLLSNIVIAAILIFGSYR